nr:hypothetical protein [Vibrio vulnificus]
MALFVLGRYRRKVA